MFWEWGQFLSEVQGTLPEQEKQGAVFKADQRNKLLCWFKLKHMCSGNPLQAKRWGSFLGRQYIIFKESPKENSPPIWLATCLEPGHWTVIEPCVGSSWSSIFPVLQCGQITPESHTPQEDSLGLDL